MKKLIVLIVLFVFNFSIAKEGQKKYIVEEYTVLATAYCPCKKCCGHNARGRTSTGRNAYSYGIAVDPTHIEYGSLVYVPGYGTVQADDCGGAIKTKKNGVYRIDVRFFEGGLTQAHRDAVAWGVKKLKIKVFVQVGEVE